MGMYKEGMQYIGIDKGPVIFCCTHNPTILNIISKIAFDKHVRVFHYIDPDDVMAIPYDIAIIDRSLFTKNAWENYIEWQKTLDNPDDCPFIFLDQKPIEETERFLRIKSFHTDFEDNYEELYNFLKDEIYIIINRKCRSKEKEKK